MKFINTSVKKVQKAIKGVFGGPKKVGLALGGGGALGIAHIGVIKVLANHKIPIDLIAGTSSGALFGALFAGGVSPYDMAKHARMSGWMKLVNFKLSKTGPIFGGGIEKLIEDLVGKKKVEDLRIPLSIITTDLKTGEKFVIKKGDLAKAVHASSAIPGIFAPVEFEGRLLCDGLVVENVPVKEARAMGADLVIAVNVIPDIKLTTWDPNVFELIERALDIACKQEMADNKALADIVLDPVKRNISAFSINEADELIRMGEEEAEKAIPEIKKALNI